MSRDPDEKVHNEPFHEYSSLFIVVIELILSFRFDALTELGAFMRIDFLLYFCIKSCIETQGEDG